MSQPPNQHWTGDEFSQPEVDYTVGPSVSGTRKRSGQRSKEAKAAALIRYRARHPFTHKKHHREYMRHWRAEHRLPASGDSDED